MNTIIETLLKACSENLELIALLLIGDLGTTFINIALGTIIGSKENGFDFKKFFFGFAKLVGSQVLIFGFCYFLNLISLTVDLFEKYLHMQIFADDAQTVIVAVIDVAAVIWARLYDTCKDVLEKIKSLKTLKYISYDDIQIQENAQTEKGIG